MQLWQTGKFYLSSTKEKRLNRQKLTELITFPERINSRHTAMLSEMAAQYPYATVIQILLGKSKQQQPDARTGLATAALYTPNRQVLRQVMEDQLPPLPGVENSLLNAQPGIEDTETASDDALEQSLVEAEQAPEPKADVFEELQHNLKKLRNERRKWHQATAEAPADNISVAADATSVESLAGMHPALKQIVEAHEQQSLDNPRIMHQRNLIDSFLENASSLPRRQPQPASPGEEVTDLSQRMSLTPHDLATETLALIMEKQGKTEKAIDIYQKLILKYPQKSAYFADCIERLKKEF